jgi:hypothetical protein
MFVSWICAADDPQLSGGTTPGKADFFPTSDKSLI